MKLKHEDAILKEVARKNIEGFAQLLGIESKVKEIYPTDGLHFDPKQFQAYMVYLFEDGTLLDIEFQTTFPKKDTMDRIKYYGAGLQFHTHKTTKSIIIYSGFNCDWRNIDNLMELTDFFPRWILSRQKDADKILSNIKNKIENNENLNSLDCCKLSLILLFGSKRTSYDVVKEASNIVINAKSLSIEQKRHVANIQYILSDKFLPLNKRDEINEVFSVELDLFDEFIEQGIEQGIERGKLEEARIIAKNLLDDGFPIENICKTTGLTKEEILKL